MKILHTADWHLGKKLNDQIDLIEVQRDLLDQIQKILEEENIDVFVLAGDIYQTVQVSDDATSLLNQFLKETVRRLKNTLFILVNGNHDPAEKLNFGSDLMVENLKIISKWNGGIHPIQIQKNQTVYNFFVIPFLRVLEYKKIFPNKDFIKETKDIYEDLLKSIQLNKNHKNILITHTAIDFLGKQERYDSEDDTYGNVGLVPYHLFQNFDLVLLGHYHRYQKFDKNIFYSGSIYKYSVKEHNHKKGVLIHHLEENETEFKELNLKKDVIYLQGTFQEILQQEKRFTAEPLNQDFFYIELWDSYFIPFVKEELSKYYKNIIGITYSKIDFIDKSSFLNIHYNEIAHLSEVELFKRFLEFTYSEKDKNQFNEILKKKTGFREESLVQKFKELWDEFLKE
ncbi:MAG: exonuclease SbcCD subunit D [Leptonema sp. (in: bacteria)]